jgi:hypothetical protein
MGNSSSPSFWMNWFSSKLSSFNNNIFEYCKNIFLGEKRRMDFSLRLVPMMERCIQTAYTSNSSTRLIKSSKIHLKGYY